ncbi:ATP phosphoribosyltransferase [Microlunatus sp. Gsoil 973]|uniref:ATP phosphoribosyltransferase n=1 Tax=Microlunatus sp. Gsoil 973 TaxID=2672569 RepID=UPI0012B4BC8C|nr:ATP phosphoribosyltransferase [Microlunatus sp. Gsoil 973]QGN35519.1 ATP phosphoribosyltransferase [Microlunatus sp. Gsoil 973]
MLRVAVPNKGALSEGAAAILREAGYSQRSEAKQLVHLDSDTGVEFFYLRPRDIATYVAEGTLDVGFTGRDLLVDSGASAEEVMVLGFARSRFRFAAPAGSDFTEDRLDGVRLATSFPRVVGEYLSRRGVTPRLIQLEGAVESSIRLGIADVIADVVETGTTLRQAGLELFGDPILESEAILIKHSARETMPDGFDTLVRRLSGVLIARTYVMIDYDVDGDHLDDACKITPGLEGPTISPLARDGWYAVRAMVKRAEAQQLMDELWNLGARAILATDIAASRL